MTVIERDVVDGDVTRRGVPQGHHPHGVLMRGKEVIDTLFPGFYEDLVAHGAAQARLLSDVQLAILGHQLYRSPIGYEAVFATRPFLEAHLRQCLLRTPGITLHTGYAVESVIADGHAVCGVRCAERGNGGREVELEADLVVDALGKGGRGRVWLDALGFPRPPEQRLDVGVRYISRRYLLPPAASAQLGMMLLMDLPSPRRRHGVFAMAQERGTWTISLVGFDAGSAPAISEADFDRGVRDVAPHVHDLIRDLQPLGPSASYRFPAGHRRQYERLRRHPANLISTGDSLCCLNPLYGTGITTAAELAAALGACLQEGRGEELPGRFYRRAARVVRASWLVSRTADHVLNPPANFSPSSALAGRLLQQLARGASDDPLLAAALFNFWGMAEPPQALLHPRVLARLAWRQLRARGAYW
ncbi:NAD(P)/FAD-dependent oxidoreductase [Streptomyces sp. NPDC059003]|uniref:NAD(P)/FAD-dependent oxidoreductase n=1 Tax=Streptomyces sp. NPDC059003 TaxID=3346691 RepID=UPI003691B11B